MSKFSNRLTDLRESQNYSKTRLAKMLGVSLSTYANWEYGYNDPDMDTLGKIANIFNTTIDYLTGRTDDPESNTSDSNSTALTWSDLDMPMPYGGKLPEELKDTYVDLAKSYFKRYPEMLNKDE